MILLSLAHKNASNLIDQSAKIRRKILKISNCFVTQAAKNVVGCCSKSNSQRKST